VKLEIKKNFRELIESYCGSCKMVNLEIEAFGGKGHTIDMNCKIISLGSDYIVVEKVEKKYDYGVNGTNKLIGYVVVKIAIPERKIIWIQEEEKLSKEKYTEKLAKDKAEEAIRM